METCEAPRAGVQYASEISDAKVSANALLGSNRRLPNLASVITTVVIIVCLGAQGFYASNLSRAVGVARRGEASDTLQAAVRWAL
jgi:hypothetical protein